MSTLYRGYEIKEEAGNAPGKRIIVKDKGFYRAFLNEESTHFTEDTVEEVQKLIDRFLLSQSKI